MIIHDWDVKFTKEFTETVKSNVRELSNRSSGRRRNAVPNDENFGSI